jgi:hypothetical protein
LTGRPHPFTTVEFGLPVGSHPRNYAQATFLMLVKAMKKALVYCKSNQYELHKVLWKLFPRF